MCEGYRGTVLATHRLESTLVLRGKTERPVPDNSEVIKTNPSELRRHRVKAAAAVPLCSLHPNLRNAAGGHAPQGPRGLCPLASRPAFLAGRGVWIRAFAQCSHGFSRLVGGLSRNQRQRVPALAHSHASSTTDATTTQYPFPSP